MVRSKIVDSEKIPFSYAFQQGVQVQQFDVQFEIDSRYVVDSNTFQDR